MINKIKQLPWKDFEPNIFFRIAEANIPALSLKYSINGHGNVFQVKTETSGTIQFDNIADAKGFCQKHFEGLISGFIEE